jgi:hypothetical protein
MALPIWPGKFLRHDPSDIRRWARSLEHVRFCHPADHQTLDREIFEVAIRIPETQDAFLAFCASLGIAVNRIQPDDTVARTGVAYSPEVWKTLTFPITQFPDLAQPGEQALAGASVHVWIRGHFLEVVIAPAIGPFSVDEADYLRAKAIDGLLHRPGLQFREPPRDDDSCVSPKYYPEYWRDE